MSDDPLARVRAAFDPAAFRRDGRAVIDKLADYLGRAAAGQLPVLPWREPTEQVSRWSTNFPADTTLSALLDRVIEGAIHLHHPRYVGHQVTPVLPAAALCDLVSSFLNNSMAVYEVGPVTTAIERVLARTLAGALGMPAEADGVFTSGGSGGNLTALLAARQAKAGFDVWSHGATAGPPLAVLCSTQTHYSVARAARIMGLGEAGAWPVPVDARFRLDAKALPEALRGAQAAGRRVIAVVASAGSTATGAFDALDAVADFAQAHDLWFHVDGAHGATAIFANAHRHLLRGIDRADSVVWDAHKMMLMPSLVTAVLFRDRRRSYQAFAQEASYLFSDAAPEDQWFNIANRTLECTKLMMSLKVYAALALHGPDFFGAHVTGTFALARRFAEAIAGAPDFQLAVQPQANIVCFRYVPAGLGDLDTLQAKVRRRLTESGRYYLVQTRLPAGLFLRTTILNPFTTDEDLRDLLVAIREVGSA